MKRIGRIAQLGGLVLLAGIGRGAAAEPAPPAPPPAAVEEVGRTLSGAKKDFEAVKSLRDHGALPGSDSSRLALPRLPNAPTPGVAAPLRTDRPPEAKAGTNWLVEAMQKREPGRQARAEDRPELESVGEARRGTDQDQMPAERQQERTGRTPTPNPFAPYMQGWMSPGDMALLRPALEPPRGLSSPGFPSAPDETGLRQPGSFEEFRQLPAARLLAPTNSPGAVAVGKARENPYLENLEKGGVAATGAVAPARAAAAPSGVFSTTPPPAGMPPLVVPPSQTRVPDFVRPDADDKYFKPLKRF